MTAPSKTAIVELTPTGKLRVGLNMSNFLLTATDAAGAPIGVAPDLGHELGKRLGVEVELVPYPNPGALADDANKGKWDVGFLGAEPQRANEIDFTAAYVEIEATYLVPPGSPLKTIAAVDVKGIRIAVPERSAYELYLTRSLKNAELVRIKGADNAFKTFVDDKLDALAGLRPRLTVSTTALACRPALDGTLVYGAATRAWNLMVPLLVALLDMTIGQMLRGKLSEALFKREFFAELLLVGLHQLLKGLL